jgi:hypothetical protein
MSKLEVLNPVQEPLPQNGFLAQRPESLDGKVVGLLSNSKPNSDNLLTLVFDVLKDVAPGMKSFSIDKRNASRPCPEDILNKIKIECDVVITASGD